MDQTNTRVALGKTNIKISQIGLGIWSWGARFFWGYGKNYSANDLRDALSVIINAGINFIDTAEVYGSGMSEKILGKFSDGNKNQLIIATKFFPFPWRFDHESATRAIENSLNRLGISQVDLYQLHMPFPPYPIEFWLSKLANVYHKGYAKAIGVSNFDLDQTIRAKNFLSERGVQLTSNQLKYNILDRGIEKTGVLEYCLENNITVIAYSPLAMGILTGKYKPNTPPKGIRRIGYGYTPDYLTKIQPILNLMSEIGQEHGGKTIAQVAINWTMSKGTIPIPGAKNANQAMENIGALNWKLSPSEILSLDRETEKIFYKYN